MPYRNSKLTALLEESLGGDSKTLMLVHCRPTCDNINETLCTLNFGAPSSRQLALHCSRGLATLGLGASHLL